MEEAIRQTSTGKPIPEERKSLWR